MKPNYCKRFFIRIAGIAAIPALVGVSAFGGHTVITLAIGVISTLIVVLYGVSQWRGWQRLLAECEHVEVGHSPSGNANPALPAEFNEVFTAFSALESRRRKLHDCYQHHLEETCERITGLADATQAPKALTEPKIDGLTTAKVDASIADLYKAITMVRQRMAGMTRLMSILPEPLFILDETQKIRYLNAAAERLIGKKLAECAKQPFANFIAASAHADLLGRAVITAETTHAWLTNGNNDEVVGDVLNAHGHATRVGLAIARPSTAERERLFCVVGRTLAKQYGQVYSLLSNTRGETVQAVWQGVDNTLHPTAESLQTQIRLLTAEVKQSSLRNTLMGRVQSLQQISNHVDLFLRINHWFGLALQNQLPTPMPMELMGCDMARLIADKLNPIIKASKTSITVHNNGGGWVYADEEWLQTALLGVLWHAGQVAVGGMIELHVTHREPSAEHPEGCLAYSIKAPGSVLTEDVLGQWEQAFAGVALPKWLDPETPGYLPGVQLARYLIAQMGGTLAFDAEPNRSIAMQLLLPARMPNTNATPAERFDGPALEELCMGWTLGVA